MPNDEMAGLTADEQTIADVQRVMRDSRTAIPPVKSTGTWSYRIWTVRHGFDWRQQTTDPRGWSLVSVDGWHVNPCPTVWNAQRGGWDTLPGDQVQLAVFRQHPDRSERHPELDGTRYDTWQDAYDAAWNAGLMGLRIYESSAIARGLLAAATAAQHQNADERECAEPNHDERGDCNGNLVPVEFLTNLGLQQTRQGETGYMCTSHSRQAVRKNEVRRLDR